MKQSKWRTWLAQNYWLWRLYHLVIADAVAIQKPTKFKIVYEFLGDDLGTVADIGCGPGVFTRYLAAHAKQVLSVDIDSASLLRMKARHRMLKNVVCIVADVECLPFQEDVLDTVLLLEVLEHLQDDSGGVCEVGRVLKPDGKLVLSVPVPPGEVDEVNPWGHKREGYCLDEIVALLETHGFEVQRYRFCEFMFSRLAAKMVKAWRRWLRVPAPIILSWVSYLDYLLSSKKRRDGAYTPAAVVVLAAKKG